MLECPNADREKTCPDCQCPLEQILVLDHSYARTAELWFAKTREKQATFRRPMARSKAACARCAIASCCTPGRQAYEAPMAPPNDHHEATSNNRSSWQTFLSVGLFALCGIFAINLTILVVALVYSTFWDAGELQPAMTFVPILVASAIVEVSLWGGLKVWKGSQ